MGLTTTLNNGAVVSLIVRWVWDGVSAFPDCDGSFQDGDNTTGRWCLQATNSGTGIAYAHVNRRSNGSPLTVTLDPGATLQVRSNRMAQYGFSTISDLDNLTLTDQP